MKKIYIALMALLLVTMLVCGCGDGKRLDGKILLGDADPANDSFYRVKEIEHGELELLHVEYLDGTVLVTVRDYLAGKVRLVAYNVHTGKSFDVPELTVSSALGYKSGFTENKSIYTFDSASNALSLYDTGLNLQSRMNFVNVTLDEIYVGTGYAYGISGNSLLRINLTNNSYETVASFDGIFATSLSFVGAFEDMLFVSGESDELVSQLFVCDMKSGECTVLGDYEGKLMMAGQYAVTDTSNGKSLFVYDLARPGVRCELFLCEADEVLLGVGEGFVCTSQTEGDQNEYTQTLRVYSLSRGALVASTEYSYNVSEHKTNIRKIDFIDSSYAVFELIDQKENGIVIWDFASDAAESDGALHIIDTSADKYADEYKKRCLDIYEKYGIEILSGDASVRYYPDYVVLPEYDAKALCGALDGVERALEKFPEGFFGELQKKSYYGKLNIVIADALIPSRVASLRNASGYYIGLGDVQYVLLSAGLQDVENTLSHELFHAIEEVMRAHSLDEFGEWKSYNPEGFAYANSYVDETGKEYGYADLYKHTPYDPASAADVNNIYFLDYYSQTFEKEDRARIFELLMSDSPSGEFGSSRLLAKAKYLCERIDLFFDSVNASSVEYWERALK